MATSSLRRVKQPVRVAEDARLPKIGLTQARAEFSEFLDRVLKDGPVEITRYGKDAVVAVSKREWTKMTSVVPAADTPHATDHS